MAAPRHVLPLLSGLLLILAGCAAPPPASNGDPADPPQPSPDGREEAARALPFWFPGLTFHYDVTHLGLDATREMALTVLMHHHDPFHLHPSGDADAIHWSLHWGLPPMGAMSGDHIDPIINNEPLGWMSFPLTDGKTWTGKDLDGTPLDFRAERTTARLPDERETPAYRITGSHAGTPRLALTYAAESGWFTQAWRDADGDGTPEATAHLVRIAIDPDLRGEHAQHHIRLLDVSAHGAATPIPPTIPPVIAPAERIPFDIPATPATLVIVHAYSGGAGLYRTQLAFADGTEDNAEWVSDGSEARHIDLTTPSPAPGEATALVLALAADGEARLTVSALVPV